MINYEGCSHTKIAHEGNAFNPVRLEFVLIILHKRQKSSLKPLVRRNMNRACAHNCSAPYNFKFKLNAFNLVKMFNLDLPDILLFTCIDSLYTIGSYITNKKHTHKYNFSHELKIFN